MVAGTFLDLKGETINVPIYFMATRMVDLAWLGNHSRVLSGPFNVIMSYNCSGIIHFHIVSYCHSKNLLTFSPGGLYIVQ